MNPPSDIMNSQPFASPGPVEDSVPQRIHEKTGTGPADGFLFPPDDLIRSVLDLTLKLEKLGIIEIHLQSNGAHFYRIVDKLSKPSRARQPTGDTVRRLGTIFRRRGSTLCGTWRRLRLLGR